MAGEIVVSICEKEGYDATPSQVLVALIASPTRGNASVFRGLGVSWTLPG